MSVNYGMSNDTIKNRITMMIQFAVLIPLGILISFMAISGENFYETLSEVYVILGVITLILLLEIGIVGFVMIKKIKQNSIELNEIGFSKIGGKYSEHVNYSDIKSLKITSKPNQNVEIIKIKTDTSKTLLAGYENMNEIAKELKTNLAETAELKEKVWKVNWNNPYFVIIYYSIAMAVFIAIAKVETDFMLYFSPLLNIAFGIFFVFFKPISRASGKRFRILELIIGIALIGIHIITLSSNIM